MDAIDFVLSRENSNERMLYWNEWKSTYSMVIDTLKCWHKKCANFVANYFWIYMTYRRIYVNDKEKWEKKDKKKKNKIWFRNGNRTHRHTSTLRSAHLFCSILFSVCLFVINLINILRFSVRYALVFCLIIHFTSKAKI